jgi:hypothetical protein
VQARKQTVDGLDSSLHWFRSDPDHNILLESINAISRGGYRFEVCPKCFFDGMCLFLYFI